MNYYITIGSISLFIILSLIGLSSADNSPHFLTYIQGGEINIVEGTNGSNVVTITEIVPYAYTTIHNKSSLFPVQRLLQVPLPQDAALVLSGADWEVSSINEISNLSFSEDNTVITFHAKPLEFYEEGLLNSFTGDNARLNTSIDDRKANHTKMFLEMIMPTPDNDQPECCIKSFFGYDPLWSPNQNYGPEACPQLCSGNNEIIKVPPRIY